MTQDVRFAWRMIRSHRWFSAAVIATLALGIGLNTMVFTLIYAALLKPVPVPGGERLVAIRNRNLTQTDSGMRVSYPDFRDYRASASSFEALEAASQESAAVSEQGNPPQNFSMDRVSSGMFEMLHTPPILGRGFGPADEKPGAPPVLLLGYGVWKDRYSSSPTVIGRVVRVNTKPATIIGVMPEGFKFPENQDMWMALVPTPELEIRSNRPLQIFGILKPGIPITQAGVELEGIARRLASAYAATNKDIGVRVETFQERYNGGNIRIVFLLMLAAVGFVLLIACANVANMMLSRALGRQREISVRAALGASRWQLVRQLLIESMMLSVLGGLLGLALAALGVHFFALATQDVGKPYWVQFTMEYAVFGYFAGLCILSGLLFGLVPALRSSRADLNTALKDGTRSAGTQRGGTLAGMLVVFQFALTLVLLTGAGVFVRSFLAHQSLNRQLPTDQLLTGRVNLPKERYASPDDRLHFFEKLLPGLRAIPGVTQVAIGSDLPGMGAGGRRIEIEHAPPQDQAHRPSAAVVVQFPGYFAAINLPILLGRDFNDTDGAPGHQAAVVTKEFAEHYWPNQEVLGKRFRLYGKEKPGDWTTVIGVSADIVQQADDAAPNPLLFLPYRQERYDSMALLVRTTANPTAATSAVRALMQNIDQDLPLYNVRTLAAAVEKQQWYLRLFGTLFGVFAMIALLMASVGIYAVIAQATSSRTQEIGVRMALGATASNILRLVLARGMKQLTAGLVLGLAAAFPAARFMATLPLRVSQSDPTILVTVSLILTTVGLFACWLPARRAAALNPIKAIRYE
jgi:putative ABC transport system permease protein